MSHTLRVSITSVFLLLGTLLYTHSIHAATITVTAFTDDVTNNGNCTLREAIKAANTNLAVDACTAGSASGTDTIVLAGDQQNAYILTILGAGEDNNATGDLDITSNVAFQGAGRNTTGIMGYYNGEGDVNNFNDRIFDVHSGGVLAASDLSILGGNATENGGGIETAGTVTLTRVDVVFNTTTASGGAVDISAGGNLITRYTNMYFNDARYGGAIESNGGDFTIDQSYIAINQATYGSGGGIDDQGYGTGVISNTSIVDNTAKVAGGAIVSVGGSLTLDSDTIVENSAGNYDGGITGHATIQRTIISGNSISADNSESDCTGTFTSGDYNLITSLTGCTLTGTTAHNITGVKPIFNFSNGGVTANGTGDLPIEYGSPTIDAAGPSCLPVDVADTSRPQRGTHGPNALCDIGAYEYVIDETAPVVSAVVNISGTTTNNTPTVSITSNETGTLSFSCTTGTTWTSVITSVGTTMTNVVLNSLADGPYTCTAQVTDAAQNVGQSAAMSFTVATIVATPAPIIVLGPYTTTQTNQNITVYATTGNATLNVANHTFTANGSFDFIATNSAGKTTTKTVTITNIDKVVPVIILNGGALVTTKPGQAYSDPGATATDDVDGNISTSITKIGTVNTSAVGEYAYVYSVTDRAGNTTSVSRKVIVTALISSISLTKGTYTTTFNGKKRTIKPLGTYTGQVFAKKMIVDKYSQPFYVFIPLDPQKSPNIVVVNYKGDIVRRTSLTSLSTKGFNIDAAYNGTSANIAIGALSKGSSVQLYRLTSSATQLVGTLKQATTGTVFVRFMNLISTPGQGYALVTAVKGKPGSIKVWRYNPTTKKYPQVATYIIKNIILTVAGLTLKAGTALIP